MSHDILISGGHFLVSQVTSPVPGRHSKYVDLMIAVCELSQMWIQETLDRNVFSPQIGKSQKGKQTNEVYMRLSHIGSHACPQM